MRKPVTDKSGPKMNDRYISIPQRFVAEIVGQQTKANTTIIPSGRMSKYRPQSSIIEFAPPFAERRATNITEPKHQKYKLRKNRFISKT